MAPFSRELARANARDANFQINNRAYVAEERPGREEMFAGDQLDRQLTPARGQPVLSLYGQKFVWRRVALQTPSYCNGS